MKVFITGGTGFVGRAFSKHYLAQGHQVFATGSRSRQFHISHPEFTYIAANTAIAGDWQAEVTGADLIINLAGRSIFKRWDDAYKRNIYDSRVLTTRNLVDALPQNGTGVLLSASAVGYYGDRGEDQVVESEPAGTDFLATLSVDWEQAALTAQTKGMRVALMRFGVVLGKGGGAFEQMARAFKFFVGGPLGNGQQWFPWIHMDDLVAAGQYLAETETATGAFNFCAPQPVRNQELATHLGRALKRPARMPAPAFMLRMTMGEFADVLLASQRVLPHNLQELGFDFQFDKLQAALTDLAG